VTATCPATPAVRAGARLTVALERADIRTASIEFGLVED
jgi:hypothetical protein